MATDTAEPAVIINDIHKEFILPQSKNTSFKQVAVNIVKKNDKVTQKVLDGVSFTVNKGDFFGIVGRNGEGKSTLLKLIAGVYSPTQGSITLNGGLTPFIELGVGFNPELSGRDNVFLNGALLGYDRKQMEAMYDEIVSFAELEPFMDQKLKNYSSGMQVRLAFSIAIKAKNDILIFDEVLAVGDEAFQRKCLDVFERYKATGQTVILVTHDMDTVKKYCNRAALISKGRLLRVGDPIRVADDYSRLNQLVIDEEIKKRNEEEEELEETEDDRGIKLVVKRGNEQSSSFAVNEVATVSMDWEAAPEIDRILLDLYKNTGEHVCNFITSREGLGSLSGKSHADIDITLNLAPGSYRFAASFWSKDFEERLGGIAEAGEFIVTKDWSKAKHEFAGTTLLDSHWRD
jgi:ABC-2 type transport system ATP-binding protein